MLCVGPDFEKSLPYKRRLYLASQEKKEVTEKICTKCRRLLPLALFYNNRRKGKEDKRYECKECCDFATKMVRKRHKNKIDGEA